MSFATYSSSPGLSRENGDTPMSMSKKDFITLAYAIKEHNTEYCDDQFSEGQIDTIADFCQGQNPFFKRDRWLAYIAGKCGPNGGAIK